MTPVVWAVVILLFCDFDPDVGAVVIPGRRESPSDCRCGDLGGSQATFVRAGGLRGCLSV